MLDLFPVAHRAVVDLEHAIAGLEARACRDAAVEHVADHRATDHRVPRVEREVDDDGQHEVRGRPGEHDHEALPERPAREAASGLRSASSRRGDLAFDAEDPDVATDRKYGDLVLGLAER